MTPPFDRRHWARMPEVSGRDAHGLGTLSEERCLQLLGAEAVGRLGFSSGSLPVVHPVNYFLIGRTIVFRSEPGQKVHAAEHGSVACMEIDRFDCLGHEGWSVLATGRLSVAPHERVDQLARLPIAPWALSEASYFIELPIEMLSGRAVGARFRGAA